MRHSDSIDKIVTVYLGGLCREPFEYKGCRYDPKAVSVSPLLLRGFTCPANCGACCGSFSLDYLPTETASPNAIPRAIEVSDRTFSILSDQQLDVRDRWCRHLERGTGRCNIYQQRPFACDFELIRLLIYSEHVLVVQKLYGRAWAMVRLDESRGTLCEMTPANPHTVSEVARKLDRLHQWARYFDVKTCIPDILDWIHSPTNGYPLRLSAETTKGAETAQRKQQN